MATYKKNDQGEFEVYGYCDIEEEDIFLGVILKRNDYYRFRANGLALLTFGHLKSICKWISESNKG